MKIFRSFFSNIEIVNNCDCNPIIVSGAIKACQKASVFSLGYLRICEEDFFEVTQNFYSSLRIGAFDPVIVFLHCQCQVCDEGF